MADVKNLRTTLQFRRDTAENFAAVQDTLVLKAGEPAVILSGENKFQLRIGDGVNVFSALPAFNPGSGGGSGEPVEIKVDGKTIVLNEQEQLELFGYASAELNAIPHKGPNGIEWAVPDTSTVDGLAQTVGQHTQQITDLQGATQTLDDTLNDATTGLVKKVTDNSTAIDAIENDLASNYYNKDAADARIDEKVDAKISAAYKPGNTVENVVGLTTPPTSADVGVIHPVDNAGTTTDDFVGGAGQEIPAGSQIVAVEQPDGSVKYDVMPSTVDLTAYMRTADADEKFATKTALENGLAGKVDVEVGKGLSEVNFSNNDKAKLDSIESNAQVNAIDSVNESEFSLSVDKKLSIGAVAMDKVVGLSSALAEKLSGIKIGDTALTVTDGVVALPIASETGLGLVRSAAVGTANGVIIGADGTMTVPTISIDNVVQPDGSDLVLDGGGAL